MVRCITVCILQMGFLCRGGHFGVVQGARSNRSCRAPVAPERLDGERLTALGKLMEARLRLGHHRELVPELEALVADSPYREGFHAQLMMALYRSGRQADALDAFRRARKHLVGELGIEPGPDLRVLQGAILRQAPELALDGKSAGQQALTATPAHLRQTRPVDQANVTASLPADGPARWRRGRARRLAPLAAILLGAAVALPTVLTAGPTVRGTVLADSLGELTAAGTGLARSVALPGPPDAAVSADGSVWVASSEENAVYRIDPTTAVVVPAIPVGSGPSMIAVNGQDIWVTNTLNGTVSRINAAVDRVVQTVPVGTEPVGIAAGGGSLWVTDAACAYRSGGLVDQPRLGLCDQRLHLQCGGDLWLQPVRADRDGRQHPDRGGGRPGHPQRVRAQRGRQHGVGDRRGDLQRRPYGGL